ncbi:hypothetical protein LWI29_015471 [Acer saccharum]|uniref:DUF1985 domain-containing protein n=1 Tax=Acer saccharum TaxID=4024 RepID=A0AA39S7D4_ACESA|nr:hypothetical protein LWI29_015471 [Acer saccharum]
MIQPIRVHGMLIYNLLKRQLIRPEEEKDDEMWFGLGEKKARFGREEFCLCSGLNIGTLPEGFQEKEEVSEESILTCYFIDENPSIELLEATFNRLTEPSEGDDALKMGYLLMVSQFFGMDEAQTAIPSWVLSLVEDIDAFESFPWGSYIFDVSPNLSPLHNVDGEKLEKDLNKEVVEEVEMAEVEKAEVEMAEVEKGVYEGVDACKGLVWTLNHPDLADQIEKSMQLKFQEAEVDMKNQVTKWESDRKRKKMPLLEVHTNLDARSDKSFGCSYSGNLWLDPLIDYGCDFEFEEEEFQEDETQEEGY